MNQIKNFLFSVTLLSLLSCGDSTNDNKINSNGTVKKTMQVSSYNENGEKIIDNSLKDDGFYQKGITPKYTRDDHTQIVTDHITGLEWEDTLAVSSEVKKWLNKEIYNKCRYDVFGNQLCQEDESCDLCFDTSGDTAVSYCEELDLDGKGWRLPTVSELFNIVDKSKSNPAINSKFENTKFDSQSYYTSTIIKGFLPITINFGEGYSLIDFPKISPYSAYVRCVRGDEATNNFIRSEQGIVQDTKTKLEWQDNYSNNSENIKEDSWKNAIDYCESLELNGTNWRLPNINELNTILDKKGELIQYFKIRKNKDSWWSATTYSGAMGGVLPSDNEGLNSLAWIVHGYNTHPYFINGESKNKVHNIRCVRNYNY